jgi:hypothetical protein
MKSGSSVNPVTTDRLLKNIREFSVPNIDSRVSRVSRLSRVRRVGRVNIVTHGGVVQAAQQICRFVYVCM